MQNEIDYLVDEMAKLNESKRVAEKVLVEIENPLHVAQECLYYREQRQSTDLVHDDPEKCLLQVISIYLINFLIKKNYFLYNK